MEIGEVITTARRAAGWFPERLADAAAVDVAELARYEAGADIPGPGVLRRLTRQLGITPHLVRRAGRAGGLSTTPDAHLRGLAVSPEEQPALTARLDMVALHMATLAGAVRIRPERRLPTFDPATDPTTAARFLRAQWRLPADEIPALCLLLDSAGILVVERDLGGGHLVNSVSRWCDGHPVILLRAGLTTARKRWVLAHEVGHLVMHTDSTSAPHDSRGDGEQQAEEFAAELLMPDDGIGSMLAAHLPVVRFPDLQRCWGVPVRELVERAHTLGTITPRERDSLLRRLGARGMLADDPRRDKLPPEHPGLAAHIALSLARLGMSPAAIAEAAGFATVEANTVFVAAPGQAQRQPA